jgi:hypothetical protein
MPVPDTYPYVDHTKPPYLRGPIPSNKKLEVTCPNESCRRVYIMWSPTITGVLVCEVCNTRLKP